MSGTGQTACRLTEYPLDMITADTIAQWAGVLVVTVLGGAAGLYIGRAFGRILISLAEATDRILAARRTLTPR